MRAWIIAIVGTLLGFPSAGAAPFDVSLISCGSNTHAFSEKICSSFRATNSTVPEGVQITALLNEEVTFSCRAVEKLGALQKRVTTSTRLFLSDQEARPTLSQQIEQAAFLAKLRSFPYGRRRALVRVEVPGDAFSMSSEGVVDIVVTAGSRSARMTVPAQGTKTIARRGMIVSKTKDALLIEIPLDTTGLCYSRRIFVWSQTYIKNSIVFGFEVTWQNLILSIDNVPNRGATR